MDEWNENRKPEEGQQTTPFQTPVRGADEMPGSGYYHAQENRGSFHDEAAYSSQNNDFGGERIPPHQSAYTQWSGKQEPPNKKRKPKKPFPWKALAAVVVVGALAFGGGLAAGGGMKLPSIGGGNHDTAQYGTGQISGSGEVKRDTTQVAISDTEKDLGSYADVYEKVSPSVVAIVVDEIMAGNESSGSGVIMSKDGYIITNNHVVEGGDKFTVILNDSTTYNAALIGRDEQTDLAVIKIDAKNLTAAEFGNSEMLKVGDRAFAIGSPGGIEYQNSFTGGFISAINRDVTINDRVMTLIQTDTAINPGNSGGALINSAGQVIGITSSKLSASSMSGTSIEGMGFAIPMATAKEIVDELIAYGHVTGRPAIGISGYDLDEARASYFNLPQGVYVSSVDTASDAFKQGIQSGDIITGVNGKDITCMSDINEVKSKLKAGDSIKLTIYRDGKKLDITIALIDEAELSGTTASASNPNYGNGGNTNPYGGYGYGYMFP